MLSKNNRREFLRSCCSLGAAAVTANLSRLGLLSANAQSAPGYKALVCVFFFGGNDSNNMIVPIDSRYSAYQSMRGAVALPQADLLPAGGSGFAFHPALANIQRLYNQQRVALVFNVGTRVRPTTKATLDTTPLPRSLFSHSDQVQEWQTSDPNGGGTGWGGRINDLIGSQNSVLFPPGISVNSGNSLFLSGQVTKGLNFSNSQSFGFETFGDDDVAMARLTAVQKILTFDSGLQLISAANGVLKDSIRAANEINAALQGAPALPVAFPNSGLGQQLAQVAQVISARGTLGVNRQIFFAGMGGFDNHEDLVAKHQQLMAEVDAAFGAFFAALAAMGIANVVTLFTESEFNRTGNSNANIGTDHGWGGHHLVMGGSVLGGRTYGTFPTQQLSGPDDAEDRGNWIPTTSLDQYAATLGSWFGVDDPRTIFPNLANFTPQNLGFF